MTTEEILKERGSRYGSFEGNATIAQELKKVWRRSPAHNNGLARALAFPETNRPENNVSYATKNMETLHVINEAMEMILHKIARICSGDPTYDDSWKDIAGYAELVVKHLKGEQEKHPDSSRVKELNAIWLSEQKTQQCDSCGAYVHELFHLESDNLALMKKVCRRCYGEITGVKYEPKS